MLIVGKLVYLIVEKDLWVNVSVKIVWATLRSSPESSLILFNLYAKFGS